MTYSAAERASWTAQGAQDAAQKTYASVKHALETSSILSSYDYEVFLQGSYANSTNTRGDSDVDIVVMLKTTFAPSVTRLTTVEKDRFERCTSAATVDISDFRTDVTIALSAYYGTGRLQNKDRCVRVLKTSGYVDADVVPAYQYRRYESFPEYGQPSWIEGISIRPLSGGQIVNFPKIHKTNGEAKNKRCHDDYKPAVRQLKRLRRRSVDLGLVDIGDAPGYLVECMTFNVPDDRFLYDDGNRVASVLGYLRDQSAATMARNFVSGDGLHRLFRDDPGEHNEYTAERVVKTMWDLL